MKKLMMIINSALIMSIALVITTTVPQSKTYQIDEETHYVSSKVLQVESVEEVVTEEIVEEVVTEETVESVVEPEVSIETKSEQPTIEPETEEKTEIVAFVGDTFTASMSAYGADIGDYTANGTYIGDSITVWDDTYGNLRILAAGDEYPYGTIIQVRNSNMGDFKGIVLDRGPNIGRGEGKKFAFDVLLETSAEANQFGVSQQATFTIERVGF